MLDNYDGKYAISAILFLKYTIFRHDFYSDFPYIVFKKSKKNTTNGTNYLPVHIQETIPLVIISDWCNQMSVNVDEFDSAYELAKNTIDEYMKKHE